MARGGLAAKLLVALVAAAAGLVAAPAHAGLDLELFEQALADRAAGDPATAARGFREAWEASPDGPLAPDALFFAADVYETRLGELDVAVSLYETLLERFPRSRHAPRVRTRLTFLERARAAGDAPLETYLEVTRGYAELGSDAALARMQRLAADFPGFPLADRVALWIADEHLRRGELDLAETAYADTARRWSGTPTEAFALKGIGDVAGARGRWDEAVKAYERIPAGPSGLDPVQVRALVWEAGEQRTRSWLARAGALYLGVLGAVLVLRSRWSELPRLRRGPGRELAVLVPALVAVVLLARGEHPMVFRSLAWSAVAYAALAALSAVYLETAKLSRAARWLHAPAMVVALVAALYVSCWANGLHTLLETTLKSGPGPM